MSDITAGQSSIQLMEERLARQASAIRALRAELKEQSERIGSQYELIEKITEKLESFTKEPEQGVSRAVRRLTSKSERRIAAGATRGAGTDTCQECRGAKEFSRLNSDRCRKCERG